MPTPQVKTKRLIGGLNGSEMMTLRGALFNVVYDLKRHEAEDINGKDLNAQLAYLFEKTDTMTAVAVIRMNLRPADDPLKTVIRRYCPAIPDKTEGGWIYRGSSIGGDAYSLKIPDAFQEVEEWRDGGLRMVCKSDEYKAIMTYCEGDIGVEVYPTDESYQAALKRVGGFYREL